MSDATTRKEPHEIPPEIRALGWDVETAWSADGRRISFDLYRPLPKRGTSPSREFDWAGSFTFVRFERGGQIEGLTLTADEADQSKILAAIFSAGASKKAEKPAETPRGSWQKKNKKSI